MPIDLPQPINQVLSPAYEQFGKDKVQHFIGGGILSGGLGALTGNQELGLAAGVGAGLLKEIYDKRHPDKHTADSKDFLATALGAGLMYLAAKGLRGEDAGQIGIDPVNQQLTYSKRF